MRTRSSPFEKELYQRVDEVLHYLGDPIGVAHAPQARDEYHSYLPRVFALLLADAGEADLAPYLVSVANESMGLTCAPEAATRVVNVLVEWRDFLRERHSTPG